MTQFCTWNIPTIFEVQLCYFSSVRLKNCFSQILTTFPGPNTVISLKQVKLKQSPNESILHPKHTCTVWTAVHIVSLQYSWKMFRSNFDDFSGSEHHRNSPGASKVEKRAGMTPFYTQNIPIVFWVQFSSFLISTVEKCLRRVLTTFLGPDTTRTGQV